MLRRPDSPTDITRSLLVTRPPTHRPRCRSTASSDKSETQIARGVGSGTVIATGPFMWLIGPRPVVPHTLEQLFA